MKAAHTSRKPLQPSLEHTSGKTLTLHYRVTFLSCLFVGTLALCLLTTASIGEGKDTQQLPIVSPQALANEDAGSQLGIASPPYRAQQVFPATDFASLPSEYRVIESMALRRPDKSAKGPFTETWEDIQIKMSHTQAETGNLSLVFEENIQSQVVTVYQGSLTLRTENPGPPGELKAFEQGVKLQTPFVYLPSQGNLLVEVITTSGVNTEGVAVGDTFLSPITRVYAWDPNADQGTFWGGFPMQFVFVPDTVSAPELVIRDDALLLSYPAGDNDWRLEWRPNPGLPIWQVENQPRWLVDDTWWVGFSEDEARHKEFRLAGPDHPQLTHHAALLLSFEASYSDWQLERHSTLHANEKAPWLPADAVPTNDGRELRFFLSPSSQGEFFRLRSP